MLVIDYYSDLLCVWAWIAQRRVDELNQEYAGQVEIRHHYMDVFGDVRGKMERQWRERGGVAAFAEHVKASASNFEEAPVHPELWHKTQPTTSANAHLYVKAVESVQGEKPAVDFARSLRQAFFVEAVDISQAAELDGIAKDLGIDLSPVHASIASGEAMASLLADYRSATERNLKGSPSYIMNNERQTLYGNVGYRVLSANIEELLRNVEHEASWC